MTPDNGSTQGTEAQAPLVERGRWFWILLAVMLVLAGITWLAG
jgi:hypothetical protein